jgi:hypothetical protein
MSKQDPHVVPLIGLPMRPATAAGRSLTMRVVAVFRSQEDSTQCRRALHAGAGLLLRRRAEAVSDGSNCSRAAGAADLISVHREGVAASEACGMYRDGISYVVSIISSGCRVGNPAHFLLPDGFARVASFDPVRSCCFRTEAGGVSSFSSFANCSVRVPAFQSPAVAI